MRAHVELCREEIGIHLGDGLPAVSILICDVRKQPNQLQLAPIVQADFVEVLRIISVRQAREAALHPVDLDPQHRPQPAGRIEI